MGKVTTATINFRPLPCAVPLVDDTQKQNQRYESKLYVETHENIFDEQFSLFKEEIN